jgi:tetratricopeptide (TPR) repeat protein
MYAPLIHSIKSNRLLIGIVFLSFAICLLRTPFLYGSFGGLVVTVILQVYLPGWLLARCFGKTQHPHPILRFAWVLACGLGLTICLGAVARLLSPPVPVYLIALHLLMLALALLQPPALPPYTPWKLTRRSLPLYILVGISCVVALGVSYESRQRFYGFEDQPIFISLVDWMVYHPDIHPHDLPLRDRRIGVFNGDSRLDTDGFSYNQASWVWASGVTGAQLIWYDLGALFIWTVPLITFALAYELSERERAATLSAAGIVVAGLLTLDNIVYHPAYTAFGRFALFQVNTLRQASITFMLPLALMAALSYLRTFQRRELIITVLAGIALATMHPIQITIFVLAVGATVALSWLAKPNRENFKKLLPLALVTALMLALPFIQRFNRVGTSASVSNLVSQEALADETTTTTGYFLILRDVPILGTTYIRDPADVFYSPVISLAVILGLVSAWWWRRSLAARYLFATTFTAILLFFTPGLAEFYNKFISTVGVLTTLFLIPLPLIYGYTVDSALDFVSRRFGKRDNRPAQSVAILNGFASGVVVLAIGLLVFEPVPISASARDQLRAYNLMQSQRYMHPSQVALSASLRNHLPADAITVVVTPYDVANIVIEDLPSTLITGGRAGRNLASPGNQRFFTESAPYAPWLDSADLEWLAEWGATHIVTLADTTRLPQMRLQPDRFALLDTPEGYTVFQIQPGIQPDAADALYARMNDLYAEVEQPRWGRDGFNLILPGDPDTWRPIADEWQTLLEANTNDDWARLGLAYTYLMMGQDADALPLWEALHDQYPDEPFYTDALASTLQRVDPARDSAVPLIDALSSQFPPSRILAARRLLTDVFFYRLSDEQLAQIFAVTEANPVLWDRLANLGRADEVRQRVALIMDRSEWMKAREWLDALPYPERAPEDLTAQAAAALAIGDVEGALAILKPTTDPDQTAANVDLHEDRWHNNTAAQMYYLLIGSIAQREGRPTDAEAAYQRAVDYGSTIAGQYFLAQVWFSQQGEGQGLGGQAVDLNDEVQAEWAENYTTPLRRLLSPLTIADERAMYAVLPCLNCNLDEPELNLEAFFSNFRPRGAYPIRTWRIQVVSPDSATKYGEMDIPAEFVDGALVNIQADIPLVDNIPELTPALVFIEPRYNDAVTADPVILPLVLNRPESADIPPDAQFADLQFESLAGSPISLQAYRAEHDDQTLNLTLYWQINGRLTEDYQVFVHVLDANGQQVGGGDSAPVNNRYPTSQWRLGVTIADPHMLTFDPPLPPGNYTVQIGLYRLSDFARLTINPADERVQDNALTMYKFRVE